MARAFHGSTIEAQRLKAYGPRLGELRPARKVAVLLETFLGPWCEWHPQGLIDTLRRLQRDEGVPLIFDEMQAGFGRTGRWWGFEHYGIEPDIIVGGKAMAGGAPMAFVAGRAELMDGKPRWESTFSGNALSCAACVATIQEIRRRRLIERVQRLEPLIRAAFPQAQGRGFAYAFEHPEADAIVDRAFNRGLLLLRTGRGTVKIAPPLCIRERELRRGLEIVRMSL